MDSDEHYWNVYVQINEWIKFADAKAGALISLNGVILGFVVSNLDNIRLIIASETCTKVLIILGIISLIVSLFFAIKCIFPKLNVGEPQSHIFFEHIAKKYTTAKEFKKYVDKPIDLNVDLKTQVWANSKVASKKYTAINYSIIAFSLMSAFTILFILFHLTV